MTSTPSPDPRRRHGAPPSPLGVPTMGGHLTSLGTSLNGRQGTQIITDALNDLFTAWRTVPEQQPLEEAKQQALNATLKALDTHMEKERRILHEYQVNRLQDDGAGASPSGPVSKLGEFVYPNLAMWMILYVVSLVLALATQLFDQVSKRWHSDDASDYSYSVEFQKLLQACKAWFIPAEAYWLDVNWMFKTGFLVILLHKVYVDCLSRCKLFNKTNGYKLYDWVVLSVCGCGASANHLSTLLKALCLPAAHLVSFVAELKINYACCIHVDDIDNSRTIKSQKFARYWAVSAWVVELAARVPGLMFFDLETNTRLNRTETMARHAFDLAKRGPYRGIQSRALHKFVRAEPDGRVDWDPSVPQDVRAELEKKLKALSKQTTVLHRGKLCKAWVLLILRIALLVAFVLLMWVGVFRLTFEPNVKPEDRSGTPLLELGAGFNISASNTTERGFSDDDSYRYVWMSKKPQVNTIAAAPWVDEAEKLHALLPCISSRSHLQLAFLLVGAAIGLTMKHDRPFACRKWWFLYFLLVLYALAVIVVFWHIRVFIPIPPDSSNP